MQPIGLTFKKDGELMLVHLCLGCGKISANRIAGDDNTHAITNLLDTCINKNFKNLALLNRDDEPMVFTALFGYDCVKRLK